MSKGPDAFRTISEVADDLDVPQHVLRFWETRFSTIRPLKRGGGRRYYRPDDVDLLKGIRQLLYGQGFTIRGVQRILKEDGLRFVQGIGRGEQWAAPAANGPPVFDEPDAEDGFAPTAGSGGATEADLPPDGWVGDRPPSGAAAPVSEPAISNRGQERLRQALEDLIECRRALDSLLRS